MEGVLPAGMVILSFAAGEMMRTAGGGKAKNHGRQYPDTIYIHKEKGPECVIPAGCSPEQC